MANAIVTLDGSFAVNTVLFNGTMALNDSTGSATGSNTLSVTTMAYNLSTAATVNAIVAGAGGVTVNFGTLALAGTNTYAGATTIAAGGTLQLGAGGTTGTLASASTILDSGTFSVNRSNAVTQGIDFSSAAIAGTGGLTQTGIGTLTLLAANTYTGVTTISAGILQLGNGGTSGALASAGSILNNAALVIDRSNAVAQGTDFSSTGIAGSGSLTQSGSGTLTLTAVNSYTGATNVTAGTLVVDGAIVYRQRGDRDRQRVAARHGRRR